MIRPDDNNRGHVEVIERLKAKRPSLYNVLLFNDDYTPREFVVMVLTQFFQITEDQANVVMLTAHKSGQAVCGTFPRDIAETKVKAIEEFVRSFELPLRFDFDLA